MTVSHEKWMRFCGDSQGRVDTTRQSRLCCLHFDIMDLNLGALGVLGG